MNVAFGGTLYQDLEKEGGFEHHFGEKYQRNIPWHSVSLAKDSILASVFGSDRIMRTPLNAVIGFSTLALRPQTTEQEKDSYLAKIQTSGKLLLDLINDTLTISKMDNGKLELNPAPVRLAEINASIMR